MRLLLDSHILLRWVDRPDALSSTAARAIADPENDVYISVVTFWELGIKESLGKLRTSVSLREYCRSCEFIELPITGRHTDEVATLPWHHRDPFDRMLIAQAQSESLTLVSADVTMKQYDVQLMA